MTPGKEYIIDMAMGNKRMFWVLTSLAPFLFLLSAVVFALYGPGDIIGFSEVFLFFAFISSIPMFLSLWCIRESEGLVGMVFLKSWRLFAMSTPLTLLGFGIIFLIKLNPLAVAGGIVYTTAAALPIYAINAAYDPLLADVRRRRRELVQKIKKKRMRKPKPLYDREALRRREEEVVRKALERIEKRR